MNVTAVMDSINKKQTHTSIKRTYSINKQNMTTKYPRTTEQDIRTNFINKINVRDYFLHERTFSNIKIKLNEQIIWCDKALLAAASPILCDELLKNDEILLLNDINLDDFLLMLEFIYPLFNPEINQQNISCLIKLSHRFQFNILQHACQYYVMKYLSTIRQIIGKCNHLETEDDCFDSNHNDENDTYRKKSDLIEFHDGTCVDAYGIILNLCQWLQTYFYDDNIIIIQSSK
ncbi:unnamed protein product [Adineta steineri]|uniref:BTB domain-containing protein n=1 Tax=Adineta steineri TaxID=433720 RepID=A0A818Q0W8_9BILA|nr:unnamed protein product [Adineta steineri]CAF3629008.1 unnamed protein product [Adineta steineri]